MILSLYVLNTDIHNHTYYRKVYFKKATDMIS